MKLKLGLLFNAVGNLQRPGPLSKLANAPLPIKFSFRISKVLKRVQEELSVFESKRLGLVEKYAKRNAKGEVNKREMKVDEKNMAAFQEEFNELAALETDIDFEPFKLSQLESVELAPADVGMIMDFIENDL